MRFLLIILFFCVSCSKEEIYTISFVNSGIPPSLVKLVVKDQTLELGPDSFPVCVAIKKSEFKNLIISVYAPVTKNFIKGCSCSNDKSTDNQKMCTDELNNYVLELNFTDQFHSIDLNCVFRVKKESSSDTSLCKRLK